MKSPVSLQNFVLLISSQVFRTQCVLPENGQDGRNMSPSTVISDNNKKAFAVTDGLLLYISKLR